jgi:hypothetical protein
MTGRGVQMGEETGHFAGGRGASPRLGQRRFARNGLCEVVRRFARNGGLRRRVTGGLRVLAASVVVFVLTAAPALAAGSSVVNPGTGTEPPGAGQLKTILSYLAWGVTATCVAGVLIASAKMAVSHHRGGGGSEHAGALAWVLVAAVVAGSASALVGALV